MERCNECANGHKRHTFTPTKLFTTTTTSSTVHIGLNAFHMLTATSWSCLLIFCFVYGQTPTPNNYMAFILGQTQIAMENPIKISSWDKHNENGMEDQSNIFHGTNTISYIAANYIMNYRRWHQWDNYRRLKLKFK